MADRTGIAWCDATVNFWWGCQEVSPGCDNCYARVLAARRPVGRPARIAKWGPKEERVGIWTAGVLTAHLVNRARREGRRLRVFTNSMSDFFDNAVPEREREFAWQQIDNARELDWLILTKRPQNVNKMLSEWWRDLPPHVWLGVSVENQTEANRRIPVLLDTRAAVRFLSVEPLLEPVQFPLPCAGSAFWSGVHWVIVGGESGPGRRDCGVGAIVDVARQSRAAQVPVFVKQDCALRPDQQGRIPDEWFIREWPASPAGVGEPRDG